MSKSNYEAQVRLLLRILPHVAADDCFALKGGTAINLFVRDLPRLSVDIDLTYVPVEERSLSLRSIAAALERLRGRLTAALPGATIRAPTTAGEETKLVCLLGEANVKVEVNTVLRGVAWPTRELSVAAAVEDEYELQAEMQVVSHAELFGGKIAAALDRQHPRDLFDVHQLYEHEGLSDEVISGLLVSVISHSRPMHELICPNRRNQKKAFAAQFKGMARVPFTYEHYVATRDRLYAELPSRFSETEKAFLLSFRQCEPDWRQAPVPELEHLPAVQWKLMNLRKLKTSNKKKHQQQLESLQQSLDLQR